MSRFSGPAMRPIFASKTTFDALAVDSGEESEEELITEPETTPDRFVTLYFSRLFCLSSLDSLQQEPARLTKSAIKKANRLARLERKQRQKLKPGSEQDEQPEQPVTPDTLPQPITAVIPEERPPSPQHVPSSLPSKSQVSIPPETPKAPLDRSVPIPTVSSDVPPTSTPAGGPPTITPINAPVQEIKEDYLEKYSPRNGSVTISVTSDNQVPRQDPEIAKKRQNALTRILWTFIMIGGFIGNYLRTKLFYPFIFFYAGLLLLGHAYMILLVMLCQTLVYREVTALFSLKTATLESRDTENVKGKDPWSKTLNWYFFAVTNYFLYGESIIYYFKVYMIFIGLGAF